MYRYKNHTKIMGWGGEREYEERLVH